MAMAKGWPREAEEVEFDLFVEAIEQLRRQSRIVQRGRIEPSSVARLTTIEKLLDLVTLDIEEELGIS